MTSPATDQPLETIDSVPATFFTMRRSMLRMLVQPGPYLADIVATAALLAWPALALRSLLLWTTAAPLRISDLRGYVSDAGVAGLLSIFAFADKPHVRRWAIALAFVLLAGVSLANFEHVRANGSSFDIGAAYLLFDRTFARGSVLGANTLSQVAIILLPPLVCGWLWQRASRHPGRRISSLQFALPAVAFILFEMLVAIPSDRLHWRQQHPLAENAGRIWRRTIGRESRPGARAALPTPYEHLHQQDLSGTSLFASRPPVENVLLVLIEGLSRGHIFNMMDPARGPGWLPSLADFAGRHTDFTQFVSLQRQTNRGEYTVLCGDSPNLITVDSEMDVYSATSPSERAECLPAFLRRHGLATTYLQAAPITFMGKDEFLPNTGFSSVLDTKWFTKAYATSGWGVDDRAFFEQAGDLISELEKGDAPWFLTLLTVGTHHPYLIPEEWQGRSKVGAFEDSLLYLDAVLKQFLTRLERSGVLNDTLVLITGDESAGYILENETAEMLSQHSVPLIVAYPGDNPRRVHERFAHSDIALSVADALGWGSDSPFHGRSAFRHYPEGRRLAFGNMYLSKLGAIGPGDELLLCDRGLDACSGFVVGKEDAFLSQLVPRGVGGEERAGLKQVVLALDRKVPPESTSRVALLKPGITRLRPKPDPQLLLYGKYHDTVGQGRASVRLAFGVTGGPVLLHHDIANASGTEVLYDTPRLPLLPGMSLEWDYDMILRERFEQLEFRMEAANHGRQDILVDVREATVQFSKEAAPAAGGHDAPLAEIVPRHFRVTLSKAAIVDLLREDRLLGRSTCVKDGAGGSWVMEGCEAGAVLYGPYLSLPAQSTVRLKLAVFVEQGRAKLFLDMVSGEGRNALGQTKPVELTAGQREDLELVVPLTRAHSDLETRLHLMDVADFKAVMTEANLDVRP